MIAIVISWVGSFFRRSSIDRRISYLDRKIFKLRGMVAESSQQLDHRIELLGKIKSKFDDDYQKARSVLYNAELLNKKLQEALDSAQEELRTAHEITIPGLIDSHNVLIGRWKEETAVRAMRTAMAGPASGVDE